MADPLRMLYLDTGVDDKRAVLALQNITRAADLAERALLGVATAAKLAGVSSATTRANNLLAQSYTRISSTARQAAADTFYLSKAQFQVGRNVGVKGSGAAIDPGFYTLARQQAEAAAGRFAPKWSPGAFMQGITAPKGTGPYMPGYSTARNSRAGGRGNYGLGTSIFLASAGIGLGAYGFQQAAGLQRSSLLASYASGQSPASMRSQSLGLAGQYALRLTDASSLTQEVAQLGVGSAAGQQELARAGAGFHTLENQVSGGDAAAAIYRLIKATSSSTEEMEKGTQAARRYAGAIYAAGNVSAAGASEVFSMVQELEPLAQIMHVGANGTIALSAAFADLNSNQRELFRGALTRMTIQGKLDPNNPIGSLLAIAERLRSAGSDSQKLNILKQLGFTNIRDVQTASVMAASMDTFARSLKVVNEELQGTSTFDTKVGAVLGTMSGQWDTLRSSMDGAAASIVGSLSPALGVLLSTLTGIADILAHNPALAALVGIGAAGLAGMAIRGAYRRHFATNAAVRLAELGLSGPRGAMRLGRLTNNLMGAMPFLGRGTAESFASTRMGMNLAEGAGMGFSKGLGRMNGLSLGIMKMLPFGEGLAVRAGEAMAAGGIGGTALRLATGPVGWILTALSIGAPLFERIGNALSGMARQGGMLGVVFNTLSLIFDVIAAGGRLLNKAFGWIGDLGMGALNVLTGGNADAIVGGINSGLSGAHKAISGFANDKAGAQSPPPASAGVINIYTGGSRSGMQTAIDEVSRRATRSIPSNSYGGIPI